MENQCIFRYVHPNDLENFKDHIELLKHSDSKIIDRKSGIMKANRIKSKRPIKWPLNVVSIINYMQKTIYVKKITITITTQLS